MSLISDIIDQSILIEYMLGADNYTWLHYHNGRKQLISKPLRYFELQLPNFVRVHKTALVNPHYIRGWQAPLRRRMAGAVEMASNIVLPVGRRRWANIASLMDDAQAPKMSQKARQRVFFVSDDASDATLLQQALEAQRLPSAVHWLSASAPLSTMLSGLPPAELPALILLDARRAPASQLATLRQLKADARTAALPVIMLVLPSANGETEQAHASRANSVVTVADSPRAFLQTMTQVAQYWLSLIRLPAPTAFKTPTTPAAA